MDIDWEKWMAEHHVKVGFRGGKIPNDNGPNEMQAGDTVSGAKVEAKVSDHAGSTGGSHIQKR